MCQYIFMSLFYDFYLFFQVHFSQVVVAVEEVAAVVVEEEETNLAGDGEIKTYHLLINVQFFLQSCWFVFFKNDEL